ncbi:DsbA family oxidoreductase [Streptomyces sp. NPDC005402]|uniref:DsbA family oxidoreductase n=1 Tax=Streptomyces sp. NPDC005402 TaxID=3155338 RepID=UPI0033BC5470
MKIEIWAEVTCPWCGLGSHRLDQAVEQFEHGDEVEVIHRSFPISDSFPVGSTLTAREALVQRHGMGEAQIQATTRAIEALAEKEGLSPYIVLDNQVGNTRLAHAFLAHASAEGKNRAAWDAIFRAYFRQGRSVFGLGDLLDLADELGLDREKTRQVLTEGRFRQQVQEEAGQAQRLGATGAPFIVVDGRYAVPGAQDTDRLLSVLRKVWAEAHPAVQLLEGDAGVCGPDGCAVPADHPAHT